MMSALMTAYSATMLLQISWPFCVLMLPYA